MRQRSIWEELAQEFGVVKVVGGPLYASWHAFVGSEGYGIWCLRPDIPVAEESRAQFSLLAARAIEQAGVLPTPQPQPFEYFPDWGLYCKVEEAMASKSGEPVDLSDAVPCGLGTVDQDAVDACTRAWLELLRRESPAFQLSVTRPLTVKGKLYQTCSGTIRDLCTASAVYSKRRARGEIGSRLAERLEQEIAGAVDGSSNTPPLAGDVAGSSAQSTAVLADQEAHLPEESQKTRKPVRRNSRYEEIDRALREISEARPKSHEEVFRFLNDRGVGVPNRRPFKVAGGWFKGFQRDGHAASAWLSQAWGRLGLPAFPRGPK